MARTPDVALKLALLDRVVSYLGDRGLGDVSLRPMAAELGVSVNTLVHHFGSKGELIVTALERAAAIQEQVQDGWLERQPRMSQADLLRQWWRWLNDSPANLAMVRLGLEAAALDATRIGLPGDVRAEQIGLWRTYIEQRLIAEGVPRAAAGVEASLAKAMFTGLVIDLIATGDRRRLGRALGVGLRRLERLVASSGAELADLSMGAAGDAAAVTDP